MPGPAPKLNPVRRNARTGPLMLPSEGRKGPAPAWPLRTVSDEEAATWDELWATPQAVAWEKLGYTRSVARYCRFLVLSERTDAPVTLLSEVRQMEDRLGLTPMAMRRLLWQVAPDEVAERRGDRSTGARRRLRAVDTA